jgi:Family of unknown function (DUF6459)
MQENLPPELPLPTRQAPVRPVTVPMLPTRRRAPGTSAPLPDPVAVRRIAIPDAAPPYDDEPHHGEPPPLDGQPLAPAGPPTTAADAGPGEPQPGDHDDGESPSGSPPPGGSASPGRQPWPSQFAQVLAETLAGSRPATQLRPWTTEQTRKRIRQLGPMLATGQRPRVRRIMTSAPSPDVLEMTAVVGFGSRVRVLALRLERGEDACQHWRCTAIESA